MNKYSTAVRSVLTFVCLVAGFGVVSGGSSAAAAESIDTTTRVAVSSWGTDRMDMFARGTDGTLRHSLYNGRWSAWESLGGAISSAPAGVSWGPGRIDVFAQDAQDGSLLHRAFNQGRWEQWDDFGGTIVGEPSVTSRGPNRLDVFVRGTDNELHQKYFDGTRWSGWGRPSPGFKMNASPAAVSWGPNRIDIFARGAGNELYTETWNGSTWSRTWGKMQSGPVTSAPAAVATSVDGVGFIEVFVRATRDEQPVLLRRSFGYGQWTNWISHGGPITTAPAATRWPGRTDVFARGRLGEMKHLTWSFVWGQWQTLEQSTPTLPIAQYTRTAAMQASPPPDSAARVGPLVYAYVNNIGQVMYGHQSDPSNVNSVQWNAISGNEAFAGPPTIVEQPGDKRLQVSALHLSGDLWASAHTATVTHPVAWLSQGGQMRSVTVARQANGDPTLLAVDATGAAWYLPQSSVSGAFGTWRSLGITGLAGAPNAVPVRDGLQLFGVDTAGAVRTATLYPAGTTSAWTNLGDTAGLRFTGTPAAVVYPGHRLRVFARTEDGTVQTKSQDAALAWPAAWTAMPGVTAAGDPAAVLSPTAGTTEVMVRDGDGQIYNTGETAQGSGAWREWRPTIANDIRTATDPTMFTYDDGYRGLRWLVAFRTADQRPVLLREGDSTTTAAVAESRFRIDVLPAPTKVPHPAALPRQ